MRKLFYFSVLLLVLTGACSPNPPPEKAKQDFQADSMQVEKWNEEALGLIYTDPKKGLQLADSARLLAQKTNNAYGEIRALLRMGIVFDIQNEDSSAIAHLNAARELAAHNRDSIALASANNNLGLIYWKQNHLNEALEYFKKAYSVFEALNSKGNLANVSNNIGLIYTDIKDYQSALNWFHKTKNLNIPDQSSRMADVYANLGNVYVALEHIDSTLYYYELALEKYRTENNRYGLGKMLSNYGDYLYSIDRKNEALPYLKEALEITYEIKNFNSYVTTAYVLSNIMYDNKEFDKEKILLDSAYALMHTIENNKLKSKICKRLAIINFQLKNAQAGQKYLDEYFEHYEAFHLERLNENIVEFEKKWQLEDARKKIHRAESAMLQSKIQSQQKSFILYGLLLCILLSSVFLILYLQKRKAQTENEKNKAILEERNKGIKAILEAQEAEKFRIARDLHDSIGQKLSVIQMRLSSGNVNEENRNTTKLLNESIQELRDISHNLYPPNLENGLIKALESLSDDFNFTSAHSRMYLNIDQSLSDFPMDKSISMRLYRIVQEFVNNTVKYAQADSIHINVSIEGKELKLELKDNGIGFDWKEKWDQKGLGLKNIYERVMEMNGKMEYNTKQGCQYKISIPL